jgi:DNA-binding winged helix-turn-helix (wHTH) protein
LLVDPSGPDFFAILFLGRFKSELPADSISLICSRKVGRRVIPECRGAALNRIPHSSFSTAPLAAVRDPGHESGDPGAPLTVVGGGTDELGFTFGSFRLEADGSLFRGDAHVHLPPRELAALRLLLANAGKIITPSQMKRALWGDVHVSADSVPKCLSSLRARLAPEDCIQTIYKRGYRFSAAVEPHRAEPVFVRPRLAILPFTVTPGIPEHLGPAIAESTCARLTSARRRVVSVLALDSVFTLARRNLTALEIGQALHADIVLAGTLRALPSHFRMRAEMIRVEDGTQIWIEDALVDRSRIAGIEEELVNRLAFRLSPTQLSPQEAAPASSSGSDLAVQAAISGSSGGSIGPSSPEWQIRAAQEDRESWDAPTTAAAKYTDVLSISAAAAPAHRSDPRQRDAYEMFQFAHHEWQTLERHRMQDSLQHLSRAAELDPDLIAARVDLVNLCVTQALYGFMAPSTCADLVRRTAESVPDLHLRAQNILPGLGWISFHYDHDLTAALQAFELSAHLPHDPWITRSRTMFMLSRHRFGEAIDSLRAIVLQDSFSPWVQARLAWALHLDGQAAASVEQAQKAIGQFPENEGAALYGAMIMAFNGETKRAITLASDLAQRLPYFDLATVAHAYALACAGQANEAQDILERLQWLSRERFVMSTFTPAVYVALGNHDAALAELRASAESRCPWLFQTLADPRLKPLHGYPEFGKLRSVLTQLEAEATEQSKAEE